MEWREQHDRDYIPSDETLVLIKVLEQELTVRETPPIPLVDGEVWLVGKSVSELPESILDLIEQAFAFRFYHLRTFKRTMKIVDQDWLKKYVPGVLHLDNYEDLLSEQHFNNLLGRAFPQLTCEDNHDLHLLRYDSKSHQWFDAPLAPSFIEDLLDCVYSYAGRLPKRKDFRQKVEIEQVQTRHRGRAKKEPKVHFSVVGEIHDKKFETELIRVLEEGFPIAVIEKLVKQYARKSHIEVDWQYRILLPDFKRDGWDGEIVMDPLPKTILIFFLLHPELRLNWYQLEQYENDFLRIYKHFSGRSSEYSENSIHNMLTQKKNNPFSTNVNDIKQAFLDTGMHDWIAQNYYVFKNKEGYGISTPSELIVINDSKP